MTTKRGNFEASEILTSRTSDARSHNYDENESPCVKIGKCRRLNVGQRTIRCTFLLKILAGFLKEFLEKIVSEGRDYLCERKIAPTIFLFCSKQIAPMTSSF